MLVTMTFLELEWGKAAHLVNIKVSMHCTLATTSYSFRTAYSFDQRQTQAHGKKSGKKKVVKNDKEQAPRQQ